MYTYTAYNLNIHSVLPLPELIPGDGQADVIICLGKIKALPTDTNGVVRQIYATDEGIYLRWQGVGSFLIREGREIIIDPLPDVEEHVLRLFILGTSMAVLLHQRGELAVLHASAVTISGQAVAFMGVKGAGKSSMAAMMHARGHKLVADDVLGIDLTVQHPSVVSGFPHLKLWPNSIESLGYSPDTLPKLRPEVEKRGYRLIQGFALTPTPLKFIYILGQGQEPEIQLFPPQKRLFALMSHWYGARFGKELLQALGVKTHFTQCTTLARQVPVFLLRSPRALSRLPEVAQLVEHHVLEQSWGIESRQVNS